MSRREKKIKIVKMKPYGPQLPTTGPYKLRRPWQEWEGGPYKRPKTDTYEFGGKKYELSKGGGADMGAKKEKYNRGPQSRNKMQPSKSMSVDTTTGISKMKDGGMCKGAGAAIKGTKFQGVF